jgi:peroxiredoxin
MKQIMTFLAAMTLAGSVFAAAEVGQPAPDFTATDINGKTVKLSDYKGKIVVLESYNFGCPFCANHFKTGAMQELQAEATAKGVVWLLVNSVNARHPNYLTPEAARAEWDKLKIKATTELADSSGTVGHLYGMRTTPHMFVIAADGTLAYDGAIDDRASSDEDPRTAHNYVRAALKSLQNGEKVAVTETKSYGCSVKYAE